MGYAESSESTIFLGKSTTEGTEATVYETLTPISNSLEPGFNTFQSEDIDATGKGLDSFRSASSGRGDIVAHWRPLIFDSAIEAINRGAFTAADTATLTVTFAAPSGNLQTVTDDGVDGFAGAFAVGDIVNITGTGTAANRGLFRITARTDDQLTIYNPGGASEVSAASISFDNNGVSTLGTTKAWMWAERLLSDGTQNIQSEFYGDLVPESWNLTFPAAGPSRTTFRYQGDVPTITVGTPVSDQRGGSDNNASTNRLVHGMDDVKQIVLYNGTIYVPLTSLVTNFEFTVSRNIRQDSAVGSVGVINTSASRPTVSGRFSAFVNADTTDGPSFVQNMALTNPDGGNMHIIWGATNATGYGVFFNTVRITAAGAPVGGNNQAILINAEFNATDIQVTRIAS